MNVCTTPVRETLSGNEGREYNTLAQALPVESKAFVDGKPPSLPSPPSQSIRFVDSTGKECHLMAMDSQEELSLAPVSQAPLDVDSILSFHRDPDAFVGILQKRRDGDTQTSNGKGAALRAFGSIKAGELRDMLPAFREWLVYDCYFTVNGYGRTAPYTLTKTTNLPGVWRKERFLRNLNACYVDIDCGRPESAEENAGLPWNTVLGYVEGMMENGTLPQASIMARSGRGLYLFWLLHDPKDPTKPQRAFPEKVALYKLVNKALSRILKSNFLPADPIHDAARVMRIPGSLNSKAAPATAQVGYWTRSSPDFQSFVYTLPDLCIFCGISAPRASLPDETLQLATDKTPGHRKTKNPGSCPQRKNGPIRKAAMRAQDLQRLEAYRGGFIKRGMKYSDGHTSKGRALALSLYAWFLRVSGVEREKTLDAVSIMAANCKPPFGSEPDDGSAAAIVAKEYGEVQPKRIKKSETLCAVLGVSAGIAEELSLQSIVPADVRYARTTRRATKRDHVALRRAFAENAWRAEAANGRRLSVRDLAKLYSANGFTGDNPQTASLDLHALGLVEKKTKPTATETQTALSL